MGHQLPPKLCWEGGREELAHCKPFGLYFLTLGWNLFIGLDKTKRQEEMECSRACSASVGALILRPCPDNAWEGHTPHSPCKPTMPVREGWCTQRRIQQLWPTQPQVEDSTHAAAT